MKLVFVHDHKFRKIDNHFFSTGGLSNEALERYTSLFSEVIVIARQTSKLINDKSLTALTDPKIQFYCVNTFKDIIKKAIRNEIESYIISADALVVRIPSFLGNFAVKLAKRHNKPLLVESVGCPWDALWNYGLAGKCIAPYMYFKTKSIIKRSPYVLYVTENFLQKRYPTNGETVFVSNVLINSCEENVMNKRLTKLTYFNGIDIVLGTIGGIDVLPKGQETVIRAIPELVKRGYNVKYRLLGSGSDSYLKFIAKQSNIEDRVFFDGTLTHEKVFDWLDDIDIYIQPSKQEGLPRSLIEAMSRGCPSIGSNAGGIPELLNKRQIFTRGNVNSFIDSFIYLMGSNLEAIVKSNFDHAKLYLESDLGNRREIFIKKFYDNVCHVK